MEFETVQRNIKDRTKTKVVSHWENGKRIDTVYHYSANVGSQTDSGWSWSECQICTKGNSHLCHIAHHLWNMEQAR